MSLPHSPLPFYDGGAAFAHARHRARYAHETSVVFARDGAWFVVRYGRDAIKAAMLASGTKGHFTVYSHNAPMRVGWREAVIRLRNVRWEMAR